MESSSSEQQAHVEIENTLMGHEAEIEKGGLRLSMYSGSPTMVFIPTLFVAISILPIMLVTSYWQNAPSWAIILSVVGVAVAVLGTIIRLGVWWGGRSERRQKIVDEFLSTNHFLTFPSYMFQVLREEFTVSDLTPIQKTEIANAWHLPSDVVDELDPLTRFISWAVSAAFVAPFAQSSYDAYLQLSGERRLIAVTEIINYNWNWVIAIPLNAPSSIASVYVSVNGGGDRYYDKDDEVDVALVGERYSIFTGKGGGSDAYYVSDKLDLAGVDQTLLPFDFEVYNKLLIIRQPLADLSRATHGRYGVKELFHPETMEQVVRQANYLLSKLDVGGEYPFSINQLAVTGTEVAWSQRVRPARDMLRRAARRQSIKLGAAFVGASMVLFVLFMLGVYLHGLAS